MNEILFIIGFYFGANLILLVTAQCLAPLTRREALDLLWRGWPMLLYILFSHRD